MGNPLTTREFLDALKQKHGWSSDYRLGKYLGWKQGTVSTYRTGRSTLGQEHAVRIADELELDRGYVLACMEAERAGTRSEILRETWRRVAQRMRGAAVILIAACWVLGVGFPEVSHAGNICRCIHYANLRRRGQRARV